MFSFCLHAKWGVFGCNENAGWQIHFLQSDPDHFHIKKKKNDQSRWSGTHPRKRKEVIFFQILMQGSNKLFYFIDTILHDKLSKRTLFIKKSNAHVMSLLTPQDEAYTYKF